MSRYIRRPRLWVGDDVLETSHELNDSASHERALTVFERDREPTPTGLYDHTGTELYREPDINPLGFYTGKRR